MSVKKEILRLLLEGGMTGGGSGWWNRLLSSLVIIIGLAIVSAMLVGAAVLLALYGMYHALVMHGLEPAYALGYIAGMIGVMIALSITALCLSIARIKNTTFLHKKGGLAGAMAVIGEAFMDGFLTHPVGEGENQHNP